MVEQLRIAVFAPVGHGDGAYVQLLAEVPGVQVVIADPGAPEATRAAANRLGVSRVDNWDEVFALRPAVVIVAGEVGYRRELVERAAEVGAHVFCEHPLAAEKADAQAMVDACDAAGVQLSLASPAAYSPAFAAVRQGIADSGIGKLMAVHGAFNRPRSHGAGDEGGALAANAPEVLDLVDAVLGGDEPNQVYAQVNSVVSGQPRIDSAALVSVRYTSGVVAAIDCSWSSAAGWPAGATPTVTFVGDEGSVEFTASPRLLGGFDVTAGTDRWEAKGDPRSAMLAQFAAAAAGGPPAGPTGAVGVRTLRILQAAHESTNTGRPVDL